MNNPWYLVIGALLATVGGAINNEIRARMELRREREAIKISVVDELSEVESTIKLMHEVWDQTKTIAVKYVEDLLGSTAAYDHCRPRIFLIKNPELRKEIVAFYKKLKDTAKKSEGKVSSLADTDEAKAEQTAIENSFQTLSSEAKALRGKLE
jgi:hypothetical protein